MSDLCFATSDVLGDNGAVWIPTVQHSGGDNGQALVIVGEAPGKNENRVGKPFVGESGRLLKAMYIDYWNLSDFADIYLTNGYRYYRIGNPTPKPKELEEHRWAFIHDLKQIHEAYDGRVSLLAAGAVGARVCGFDTLKSAYLRQGGVIPIPDAGVSCRFFSTFHPAAVMRNPSCGTALESHLKLLHDWLKNGGDNREFGAANWEDARALTELPSGVTHVACDIETAGCIDGIEQTQFHPVKMAHWDGVPPSKQIVSVAMSWEGGDAYYLPQRPQDRAALESMFRSIQRSDAMLLFHNAAFDLTHLRHCYPEYRRLLDPPTKMGDLMIASYLVDELRPEKSLKALAPLLMGETGVYSDDQLRLSFKSMHDPKLKEYNIADTRRTLECFHRCAASYSRLYGPGTSKGSDYCWDFYSDLVHLVAWMSEEGVDMDIAGVFKLHQHLTNRIEQLKSKCAEKEFILAGKGSEAPKRDACRDAAEWTDPETQGRIKLTKTGKFPFDDETRSILLENLRDDAPRWVRQRIRLLGHYQRLSKLANTYTARILYDKVQGKKVNKASRCIGNKIYPVWYPTPREWESGTEGGTKQGRLSAKEPSVPTFPPAVKKLVTVDLWFDYSQIELRVAALLSNDSVMVREYSGKPDLHSRTARLMFGDDIVNHPRFQEVYRQAGKSVNFLMLYRGGADKLQKTLIDKANTFYDLAKCQAAIGRFWATYYGLRGWQDRIIDFVRKTGYYELPLIGQSRWFDRNDPPINEVVNLPVQCIAADIMLSAQFELWRRAKDEGIGMVAPINIYDAAGIRLTPEEREQHGASRVVRLMQDVLPNPPFYTRLTESLGRSLPLKSEVKFQDQTLGKTMEIG